MKLTKRGWNNVLIFAILIYIVMINAPKLIQEHFMSEPALPTVLNSSWSPTALHFANWSLEVNDGQWQSSQVLGISAVDASNRWLMLEGTLVDEATVDSLEPNLGAPRSIEVWYKEQEEPQRVTYYQTPNFWLFKNWQQEWVAVSVDKSYLFPFN
ncbi:hypothetical protein [Vibrio sp. SCSIO 43136]|uniref:hypothetical protein n=1 Tax=Vibrio sp. SCSIO 43136 TaxID=2819101 RepID=UPI002074BDF3|nr:hypothetical protein [Vibrio sp. SCSIO 43136]USD65145.1 hypothetical protein J4N39_14020 [Vibrio sp. SCSIO 43136]